MRRPNLSLGAPRPTISLVSRRAFAFSAASFCTGCLTGKAAREPTGSALVIRAPTVGQTWRYGKYDYFTGALLDTQLDRVVSVEKSVVIENRSDTEQVPNQGYPTWGEGWWHEYRGTDAAHSGGAIEVHKPWGMIVLDSHWSEWQAFEKPLPLWPREIRPGWRTTVRTAYKIPGRHEAMPWELTLQAERWETVRVPAGEFSALRCYSIINFRFPNVSERNAARRIEHVWFSPDIGRWVRRESIGTFREDISAEVKESSYRWELLSWI